MKKFFIFLLFIIINISINSTEFSDLQIDQVFNRITNNESFDTNSFYLWDCYLSDIEVSENEVRAKLTKSKWISNSELVTYTIVLYSNNRSIIDRVNTIGNNSKITIICRIMSVNGDRIIVSPEFIRKSN